MPADNAAKSPESRVFEAGVPWISVPMPPMPQGFSDRAAWAAIHWCFSENGSLLDRAVIGWQKDNQERVKAAMEAESHGS